MRESRILAIDPGTTESGWCVLAHGKVTLSGVMLNRELLRMLTMQHRSDPFGHTLAIEMIASYGMAVGREVFETCVWIGRFQEAVDSMWRGVDLVYRRDVKMHHCHSAKAGDSNITQALIDRFASGEPNRGKGTKAAPGWFYGFKADIWQAYALAVLVADRLDPEVSA